MIVRDLALRGATRFEDLSLPWPSQPGLIAVCGPNGAGKTTILESIFAALYRSFPSRDGGLSEHMNGRDAYIAATIDMDGRRYESRVLVDAERSTSEAYLTEDGKPIVSGKVREHSAMVEKIFGSQELILASVFAAQNKAGNFLDMPRSKRMELWIDMLGLARLQVLSDSARQQAKALESSSFGAKAVLQAIEQRAQDLKNVPDLYEETRAVVTDCEATITDLVEQLTKLDVMAKEREVQIGILETKEAGGAGLKAEITTFTARLARTTAEWNSQRAVLEFRPQADAAVAKITELEGLLESTRDERKAAQTEIDGMDLLVAEWEEKARARIAEESAILVAAGKRREDLLAAASGLERERSAAAVTAQIAQSKIDNLKSEKAVLDRRREELSKRSAVLGEVPCGDRYPQCPLLTEAHGAEAAIGGLTVEAQGLLARIEEASTAQTTAAQALQSLDDRIWGAASPPTAQDDAEALAVFRAENPEGNGDPRHRLGWAKEKAADLDTLIRNIETQIRQHRVTADQLPAIEAAGAQVKRLSADLEEIRAGIATLNEKLSALESEVAALPGLIAARVKTNILQDDTRTKVAVERNRLAEMNRQLGDLEGKLKELTVLKPQIEDGRNKLEAMNQDLREWSALERALGRDGVQALRVDASGPEVSALINDLLSTCYGDRFSVAVVTTEPKADGKGTKEVFDLRVFDGSRGREGKVETLSGGEKVVLNEAISLGLAIYNTRKSGRHFRTLFRDETSGALDPDNARRYIQMLDRARTLGGLHQILFVAHQQDLVELADSRIRVADGHAAADQ